MKHTTAPLKLRPLALLPGTMLLLPLMALPGCDAPAETDLEVEFDEEIEPRVFGEAEYANCSADLIGFNEEILRHGRIAAGSEAFAECIDTAFRTGTAGFGPYRACPADPFANSRIGTQIDRAIEVTRSSNDLSISCTGGGGNASTGQNDGWGHSQDESFSWSGWLSAVFAETSFGVCAPGTSPPGCRTAAYPWPFSQAAGLLWHEASHTHGYGHGANDQAGALTACGYAGDPTWHFQVNTAPYIIEKCVNQVLNDSATTCGNIDSCAGDALRLVDTYGGTTCSCLEDPSEGGFASFEVDNGEFDDVAHAASGTWYGSWNFGGLDDVVGTGDFDGDGEEEVLVMSGWSLGILGRTASGGITSEANHPVGSWIGGWNFSGNETIEAVGDFDGDGDDEFVIRSGWGIGVMRKSGNGFSLVWASPFNRFVGDYLLRSGDEFVGTGRFGSAARDDLLVHGELGAIGMLHLNGSSLTSSAVNSPGHWMGGWNHGAPDTVQLPADYDDDGLDEFIIRSGSTLGIIERLASGQLTSVEIEPFGTLLTEQFWQAPGSGWTLDAGDELVAAGDMNTDGRAELVVRNADGLGLLTLDTTDQWRTRTRFFHGSRFSGGWLFGAGDEFVGIGDYDGQDGEDLLIRSGWGIGVISLRWNNYTLLTLAAEHYASMMDGWYLLSDDEAVETVDFDGDGIEEFMLRRE